MRTDDGELSLITTLMSVATATDIFLAELQLEAFLPADRATADILCTRAERGPAGTPDSARAPGHWTPRRNHGHQDSG
jgi:hypothetical protein